MSGIEPLATLGLVCNILQLIEVGFQTYELIKIVYQGGTIDSSLKQKAIILGNASQKIKPVNRPANRHEQQLVDTAESCARAARQLREEIIHLIGNAKKGRLSSAVKAALMTLWRKPRLERLRKELDGAERLMQTGLLVQTTSTINDTELDLTDLGADIRSFVQEYRKGHRDTKTLVFHESLETRTHVSNAIQGTNEAIARVGQDLDKLALDVDTQVDQAKYERLLQSLKYPGFNERRNEVCEAHPATFQWVFAGDDGSPVGPDPRMGAIKWDSFSNWLKSTDTIYWISGKPGSGKSTMIKYILANPQIQATQQGLDIWSPGCLIISHYFWRPGNLMQRSIKGMLCSLLCQLLANSETALAKILASTTGSSMKGDVTDWSLEELRSTLLSTMKAYHRPVCMFLDGLDEVYPDQPVTLMDMIKNISMAGKTKTCLASRPEPPLQRRLYNMPQLRLQDLTAADLTQYVYDHIETSKFAQLGDYEYFVESLVRRAEGVFLWLVLVTKSVQTGFDNGDTIDIINERVTGLQGGDLESLYKDMWERLPKDNPDAYRRTAALYFRIMLLYNREGNEHMTIYGPDLSVFTMMFASTDLAEKTLNAAPQTPNLVPEGTLLQGCKEVERIAKIYCFGLLEISERRGEDTMEDVIGWYRDNYDKLLPYAQARRALVFIHRTAVDFLVDTAQGKEILSFDDTAEASHAFQLVTANLAHAELFCVVKDTYLYKGQHGASGSLASTHLRSIQSVRKAFNDAGQSVSAECKRVILHCKRLCDLEKIFAGASSIEVLVCGGVSFFKAVAMHNWRCLDILEDQIKVLDKENLSEVLYILCTPFRVPYAEGNIQIFDGDFLQCISLLLMAGADPNWNGTPAFGNIEPPREITNLYSCRRTAFVEFLSQILKQAQRDNYRVHCQWRKTLSRNDLTKMLATLEMFIRHGANLDEKVTIAFNIIHTRMQPCTAECPETCQHLEYSPSWHWGYTVHKAESSENKYVCICSFPAHNILSLVLSEWKHLRSLSDQETLLADVKASITCSIGRHSGMNNSVFERLEVTNFDLPRPDGESRAKWRWCVASREHQVQIAKELMSFVDIFQEKHSAPTQASGHETLTSMLCGPYWVEKASGSVGNVFEYLAELRTFARYCISGDIHTIQDWLKLKGVLQAP